MNRPADPGLPAWLIDELATVPEIDTFAGADELAAETARLASRYPDVISSRIVGHSAGGEPLTCLTIDGGPGARHALVYGLPHPNEPAGGRTSIHLAERLAADRGLREQLGLTWHVVPAIDPDGLRLNEGWLRGPFTREHYTRNFYRQAFDEQIDWSFPLGGESAADSERERPPETRALMELVDDHRPDLLASLHNGEYGDVYYYLGRDDGQLIDTLQRIPGAVGMSLYRGVPESGWADDLSAGVYRSLDIRDSIAHHRAAGLDPVDAVGNSCSTYAARHGALSVVTEVPYWRDPRTSDTRPTDVRLADALILGGSGLGELGEALTAVLEAVADHLRLDTPFLRAARHFARATVADAADHVRRAGQLGDARMATVAERASIGDTVHLFRLRNTGLLLRALDEEISRGDPHSTIRAGYTELSHRHSAWSIEATRDAAEAGAVRNPIGSMVAVQYGAILAAADHLSR